MSDNRSKSPTKLLIVEDDVGLQRQLRWAYEDYQVLVAGDRAQAVEILRDEEPDVVTRDLGLQPDPDGTAEGFAIGRASCRARGWQYVSISAVAVSLKKKR